MTSIRWAAAVLAAAIAVPAFAQVKKVDVQGIQNFNQIDAIFACGGATDATGVANLKKQGFASIISFRLPTEQGVAEEEAAVKSAGIKYIHLPLNGAMPDPKVADQFLVAVADKANQPAYIAPVASRFRTKARRVRRPFHRKIRVVQYLFTMIVCDRNFGCRY